MCEGKENLWRFELAAEIVSCFEWLLTTLTGSAELTTLVSDRIYGGAGPDGEALPAVVFSLQSVGADMAVRDQRVASGLTVLVKAIAEGNDLEAVKPIASALDAALQGSSGVAGTGVIVRCVRDRPFSMLECTDKGGYVTHLGGLYRFIVQDLSYVGG